jgi:hypothetical protein
MNAYEKLKQLSDPDFKLITGVNRAVFDEMLVVLRRTYVTEHKRGGQPGLSVEMRLTLALEYWREYRSIRHMANDHQISKSVINRAIIWVEDALSSSPEFKLMDLQERFKPTNDTESQPRIILIDVEEQPIERPIINQEASYSGKKNNIRRNTKY